MSLDLLEKFLKGLLEHVEKGNVTWPLIVVLIVLLSPTLWGLYTRCFLLRKVETGWKNRLKDKNAEIERLLSEKNKEIASLKRMLNRELLNRNRDKEKE